MNNGRITGIKWIPFGLMFCGLLLRWTHFDEQGILLNIGFLSFGLVALIDGIKGKHYKQLNMDTLKILLPLIVVALAMDNLLTEKPNYVGLGIAIIFQYLLGQKQDYSFKKQ
ncbi:MAG: hypothetical protein RIF39_16760 [Cyclobacteriaceae bacterium]